MVSIFEIPWSQISNVGDTRMYLAKLRAPQPVWSNRELPYVDGMMHLVDSAVVPTLTEQSMLGPTPLEKQEPRDFLENESVSASTIRQYSIQEIIRKDFL